MNGGTSHRFDGIWITFIILIIILQDLQKREDIVTKKEAMLAERSELEIKKLRSSQVLNKVFWLVLAVCKSVEIWL